MTDTGPMTFVPSASGTQPVFSPMPGGHEILIATRSLPGLDALLSCLSARVDARILEPDADSQTAIGAALAERDLGALHLVGFGAPGTIAIVPGTAIDAMAVRRLCPAASPRVEVNLWSSFTGAGRRGRHFVQTFAESAQVRVLASDGLVGGPERGASWDLPIAARPRGLAPFVRPGRDAVRLTGVVNVSGEWEPELTRWLGSRAHTNG